MSLLHNESNQQLATGERDRETETETERRIRDRMRGMDEVMTKQS